MRFAFKLIRVTVAPLRVREEATVELPRSAATMFAFMADPASSVDLNDETERGLTLPGTPSGLGEIQVFLDRFGSVRRAGLIEVIAIEPGRQALARSLDGGHPAYSLLTVEPLTATSCRLTQAHWIDFPAGVESAAPRRFREASRAGLARLTDRLTALAPSLPGAP